MISYRIKQAIAALTITFLLLSITTFNVRSDGDIGYNQIFLPIIVVLLPSPTPSPTPVTPTPVTPTPVTPTTPPPASTTGNISITSIFYNGSGTSEPDEYVVIKNIDNHAIDVQNWTLRDNANHVYTFPSFTMQPDQVCRIYTNQSHPESCGFNYGSASAIWNNGGDCAYLRNSQAQPVSNKCY